MANQHPHGHGNNNGNGNGNNGNGNGGPPGNNGQTVLTGTIGDDTLFGGNGKDSLSGGDGNDTLFGGNGKDVLDGGAGNDTLDGGLGKDIMSGGTGDDVYIVNMPNEVIHENPGEGIDTVFSRLSFTLGANVENLTLTGSIPANGFGNELDNVLIGNTANNLLVGFAGNDTLNGGGGTDTLNGGAGNDTYIVDDPSDKIIDSSGIDTVEASFSYTLGSNLENLVLTGTADINGTGNALDNAITGNAGVNILTGLGGNDTLDGGAGADTMIGGAGNDTYFVDNTGDVVVENPGEGADAVFSSASFTLGANVESLTLTGTGDINATGNDSDNFLLGNAGVNILTGLGGNDTLDGGAGADTMIGGLGDDTYFVDNALDTVTENPGEGTDTVNASVSYTLTANVENLNLTGSADINGTGNALANVITGNDGNNTLDGGAGADTMIGGLGNDTYVVNSSLDIVTENPGEGTDTVRASVSYTLGADVENLQLTGVNNINGSGNASANVITGNDGNNTLNGNGGADTMDGGLGDDHLYGGSGADTLTGGGGADTFVFKASTAFTSVDTVTDFNTAESDKLDIGNLLTSFDPLTMTLSDWVHVTAVGPDTIVEVDRDGTGAGFGFTQIATLTGVTGLADVDTLVTNGTLVIA